MGRLRVLSGREVCRILEQHGFVEVRRRGSHIVSLPSGPCCRLSVSAACLARHSNHGSSPSSVEVEPGDVIRRTVYTFHALLAERWRAGRCFLLGDAAHTWRDARNVE